LLVKNILLNGTARVKSSGVFYLFVGIKKALNIDIFQVKIIQGTLALMNRLDMDDIKSTFDTIANLAFNFYL